MPALHSFKVALKKWRLLNYPSRICKIYIANVGFIQKYKFNLSYRNKLNKMN